MILFAIPALAAAAYYALAVIAACKWLFGARPGPASGSLPPVSFLKPVHGRDPRFYDAIRSHAEQDYPEFEIVFGVNQPGDPALEDIERLRREFPHVAIQVFVVPTSAPNAKAGVLAELARRARHSVFVINDSDIVVEPGYLRAVVAPLADRSVGLVTALYRARAEGWGTRLEALGIATEFVPSVLVARLLGQAEFALGSTMALSAETLAKAGGFEALADYLADDYQLGRRVSAGGSRIEFAPVVVETALGAGSAAEAWLHQLRWSRTVRISRPGGYLGYLVTHATVWSLVAFAAGQWWAAAAAIGIRLLAGALTALLLRDYQAVRLFWLIPVRDLLGFAVWVCGLFGSTVRWRGRLLTIGRDGRIRKVTGEQETAAVRAL